MMPRRTSSITQDTPEVLEFRAAQRWDTTLRDPSWVTGQVPLLMFLDLLHHWEVPVGG